MAGQIMADQISKDIPGTSWTVQDQGTYPEPDIRHISNHFLGVASSYQDTTSELFQKWKRECGVKRISVKIGGV